MAVLSPLGGVRSQTLLMPTSGHRDTMLSGCTLYDDGGPSGNYSPRSDATYTFHTMNGDNYYRIRLDYSGMQHLAPGVSLLEIYNGDSTQMTDYNLIFTSRDWHCSERLCFFASDNTITIRFRTDDDAPTAGWWMELCEAGGLKAQGVTYEMLDSATARVSWYEPNPSAHYVLEYCYPPNAYCCNPEIAYMMDTGYVFTTLTADTNFVDIPNLRHDAIVLYHLYTEDSASCDGGVVGSLVTCILPQDFRAEYDTDSFRLKWSYDPMVSFWHLYNYSNETPLDTLLAGTDTSWTSPYPDFCADPFIDYLLVGNCIGCDAAYLRVFPQCANVQNVLTADVTDSSIVVGWDAVFLAMGYVTAYRDLRWPADSLAVGDTILYDDIRDRYSFLGFDTLHGLEPNTAYEVWVYTLCDWDHRSCGASSVISTTLDNCIDYINIRDLDKVHLTWGYYDNIDSVKHYNNYYWCNDNNYTYGCGNLYFWGTDRHVPITDTTARDWNTGGLLRLVPPGEPASLRLGNENSGAEAESITYDYFVDSTDKDMLVLKYAIVM